MNLKARLKNIEKALQPERDGYALLIHDVDVNPSVYRERDGGPALTEAELEAFYKRNADKEFILAIEVPTITKGDKL